MEQLSFDPRKIPSKAGSSDSEPSLMKSRAESLDRAATTAEKILFCFPDYGKAPDEYLGNLTALLAEYPEDVQDALADRKTGIPSKVQFLPTVAAIVEMAEQLMAAKAKAARFDRIRARAVESLPRSAYVPFPALARAFASEPDLLQGKRFDQLYDASHALATVSMDRARDILSVRLPQPGDAR